LTGNTGDPTNFNIGFDDFVFDRHDGTDTITDFQVAFPTCLLLPGHRVDEIVLVDIDAVLAGVTADAKGNAVLHYGETNIVLAGIAPADVLADWFNSAGRGIDLMTIEGTDGPDKFGSVQSRFNQDTCKNRSQGSDAATVNSNGTGKSLIPRL
jgi:hypothetical protein